MPVIQKPVNQKSVAPNHAADVCQLRPNHDTDIPPNRETDGNSVDSKRIRLRVQLQSVDAVMDVLTAVTRVGGQLESVVATNQRLDLDAVARKPVALRLPLLIGEIVSVIAVSEATLMES